MKKVQNILLLLVTVVGLSSCEKVLDINPPAGVEGIVFEGSIENGSFPYVIISRSAGYFSAISTAADALASSLVEADSVFINYDGNRVELAQVCITDLPPEQQQQALALVGIDTLPPDLELCVNANFSIVGELGKTYGLEAYVEGQLYTAETEILQEVRFDSIWYKDDWIPDSLGSLWVELMDPAATNDFYYIWTENLTQNKRMTPIFGGASFSGRLFNGQSITFTINQGTSLTSGDANDDDAIFYANGDTVVVKLATIDFNVYEFWESVDAASNLNPFSAPTPVFSNIDNGGRGVWAGYAVTLDTIVCIPIE